MKKHAVIDPENFGGSFRAQVGSGEFRLIWALVYTPWSDMYVQEAETVRDNPDVMQMLVKGLHVPAEMAIGISADFRRALFEHLVATLPLHHAEMAVKTLLKAGMRRAAFIVKKSVPYLVAKPQGIATVDFKDDALHPIATLLAEGPKAPADNEMFKMGRAFPDEATLQAWFEEFGLLGPRTLKDEEE
jgi:hypothetical protein